MSSRVCLLLLLGFAAGRPAGAEPLRVGVSILPLRFMVERIAAGEATVFCAVPAGANPHLFEPPPSAVRRLQTAVIFFGIAPEFDGWAERFMGHRTRHVYLKGGDFGANPHIWLSPRNVVRIGQKIATALGELRPERKALFLANQQGFAAELQRLDGELAVLFRPLAGRKFFLWHPSWNYFAAEYGLEIAGVIESGHGDEPSVKGFQKLVARARAEGVRVVAVDLNVESSAAAALAHQTGGILLRLDSLGDPGDPQRADMIGLLRWNAGRLAAALAANPPQRRT